MQADFVAQHANYNTHVKRYTRTEEMTELDWWNSTKAKDIYYWIEKQLNTRAASCQHKNLCSQSCCFSRQGSVKHYKEVTNFKRAKERIKPWGVFYFGRSSPWEYKNGKPAWFARIWQQDQQGFCWHFLCSWTEIQNPLDTTLSRYIPSGVVR